MGAHALVKTDRVLVPVQHGPLKATVVALDGDLRQATQNALTQAAAAVGRANIEVFQIEARLAQKGAEVREEQG